MRRIDVFNGDADGLCSLRQLRLAQPADSRLITGTKRDITLLERVDAGQGDEVTVLDVSLERNRAALLGILDRGARVRYFDHHFHGQVPAHANLEAVLDASPETCTSALVDRHLGGRFRAWAVAGAFGDNLDRTAIELAGTIALGAAELEKLREMGRSLNYNAYGDTEADLLIHPAELYARLARYEDPLRFVAEERIFALLQVARYGDLEVAAGTSPRWANERAAAYVLADRPSSRRVLGTFANHLARTHRHRAHAVLAPRAGGGYAASVRVPAGGALSADAFCRQFPAGGGRREAAGIDGLPEDRVQELIEKFAAAFG